MVAYDIDILKSLARRLSRLRAKWWLSRLPLAVLLLCGLVGCGALSTAGGLAGTSSSSGTPTASTARATASATASATGASGAVGCAGGTGSASSAGAPALVFAPTPLAPTSLQRTGTAPGDALVRIELPARSRWRLIDVRSTGAPAQIIAPAGYLDPTLNACIWDLRMPPSGTVTVDFAMTSLCSMPRSCTQYALRATYTITVQ